MTPQEAAQAVTSLRVVHNRLARGQLVDGFADEHLLWSLRFAIQVIMAESNRQVDEAAKARESEGAE